MMDIKDAHKVIENLQTRPFFCSENKIELDNGYVIVKKEHFERLTEQLKIGDWIPCSERLPESSIEVVLVCLKNGAVSIAICNGDEFINMMVGASREKFRCFPESNPVIAWQPLPEEYHG